MIFKSLFKGTGLKKAPPEERLPVLHSFVDVTVAGRAMRSVSVEAITPYELVAGDALGRPGERAVFVYQNAAGRFRCAAVVSEARDGQTCFRLPHHIESIGGGQQKRSTVRMDVLVYGAWRMAPGGKGVGEFSKCTIRDISRGGCALILDRQCKVGQLLEVRMNLRNDALPLTVLGEVMRVEVVPVSGKFSHGLRFQGMTPEEDKAILEFINRKQADLRNRGLA